MLLLFLHIPSHSIEISKNLKLLDLSKVNEESCRYSGRGALTMNNKFSEFVQGHSDALPADGASMFIEDNVAYLNNAFAGYGSDKEDKDENALVKTNTDEDGMCHKPSDLI